MMNLAQSLSGSDASLQTLINIFIDLIKVALPVVVALALFVFFKGLVSFIAKAGDAKNHAEGKNLMIWGLVGIFAMVSIFGLIQWLSKDFGFTGSNPNNSGGILPLLPEKK